MPLTPIPGSTRLRAMQLGKETTFKTAIAATRRLPWSAAPTINPNWTFPTADTGTLDQAIAPYPTALDLTVVATGQLYSNDMPTIISAGIMGNLTLPAAGSAFIAAPATATQDVFDTYTGEFYDDSGTSDNWQLTGGIIESFTLEYPQDQGPINLTANWRFAKANYAVAPTGALNVDLSPVPLFCGDTEFYVNDTAGAIETTKLTDIVYGATIELNNNIDAKRFANGSNTRFQVQNYGRGERVLTFTPTGSKQSAWFAESAKWIAANPTERFWGIKTTSPVIAGAGNNHSLDIRIPGFWMTRAEAAVNTNTAFSLALHQVYDSTLTYPLRFASVSARTTL